MLWILFLTGTISFSMAETLSLAIVDAPKEVKRLLKAVDQDRDQKITVNDNQKGKALEFTLDGKTVQGVYPLSNLLQELKLAEEAKSETIYADKIFENPVHRISRSIKERFWDGLTRRIDKYNLKNVLGDSKVDSNGNRYLYVPYTDNEALEYYLKASAELPELKLKVVRLPEIVTGEYVRDLKLQHGLLALGLRKNENGEVEGVPYVVPGGRFNEMYGWDSYFEALGLLNDGRVDLARSMVDNFVYEITHYGKILNANRTYYLTRSQPPFLTSMIRAVLEHLPKGPETKAWLTTSLKAAIKEYHSVWMGAERLTPTGLSRYSGNAPGIPPEVEPGHFNHVLSPLAKKHKLSIKEFEKRYNDGKIKEPELDRFLRHDRAVRESGHDTTYRWRVNDQDLCADFVTVDLNSLLYKFELDLAHLIQHEFSGSFDNLKSENFRTLARDRKERILKYLWNPQKKMFFDYNVNLGSNSLFVSATTLYPLWAHDPALPDTKILSDADAKELIENALKELETNGGVAATSKISSDLYGDKKHARQWEWPNGWAPHQLLIWEGLKNYGYESDAERLTYKWVYMITRNAMDYNGTVPEKYDVVKRSHAVFAEYGNVGTNFSYITREGFGWMNASYQVGLKDLKPESVKLLEKLVPPEWVDFK
ncbi:MAG TPA: trehalase family glycosidase [Bacteriovoracaceae bacterium]|nr:trehalase family glycosidase [Bacteriovoracaceae bacterium]